MFQNIAFLTYPGPYVDGVPYYPYIDEWVQLIYLIDTVLRPKYAWEAVKRYLYDTLTDVREKESEKSILDINNSLEKAVNYLMECEDPTKVCVRLERAGIQ